MERYNVARALNDMAAQAPFRPAIIFPAGRTRNGRARYVQYSFQQLNDLSDAYAHGLGGLGIGRGMRTLMMVRPGIDLIAATFALLKIGAVPILIDPGMGRRAFLQCIQESEPEAFIGIPLAHAIKAAFPAAFRGIKYSVTAGRPLFWGGPSLADLCLNDAGPFPVADTTVEDEAAVAFTSGSTGIPKGVVYLQGMFQAQIDIMRHDMHIEPGEIHLAAIYIFALFNPALGVTTLIPDMDPAKTAQTNPAYLVEDIQTHGATLSLGSPTVWRLVNEYCHTHQLTLPSFKHVFMFGAPVAPQLVAEFAELAPQAKIFTPFGATEALPLTMIEGDEILNDTAAQTATGAGVCVGRAMRGVSLRIIPISDDPVPQWDEDLALPAGTIGEIVVKGPMVTRTYLNRPEQTARAKIRDADGNVWHRMGDVGYLDEQGRLWMCGRKSHRVETAQGLLLPVPCEAIFNQHPRVARTALVGLGPRRQQAPVLVIEPKAEHMPTSAAEREQFITELLQLGQTHDHTRAIQTFLFHADFPVDVRHNAKIRREVLAVWAAHKLGYPAPNEEV